MEAWENIGVPLIVALLTSTALWGVVSKVILKRQVYLYEPYEEMGGNGSARRVMEEVRKLPIR